MVPSQLTLAASAGALALALAAAGAAPAHADTAGPVPAGHHSLPRSHPFLPALHGNPASKNPAANRTSQNWSGYAASGGTYTSVTSTWVQPSVTCTTNGIAAFWVGLDGMGSPSVEQTGTAADCSTGSPVYFAWWELYPQNDMQQYRDAVTPGDVLTATVTSLGGAQYELDLSDTTKGWTERNRQAAPGALNASAEIVAEAVTSGGSISALPDFGSARFSGTRIDHAAPQAAGAEPIDMVAADGTVVAATGPLDQAGDGDFTITYQAPQQPAPTGSPYRQAGRAAHAAAAGGR